MTNKAFLVIFFTMLAVVIGARNVVNRISECGDRHEIFVNGKDAVARIVHSDHTDSVTIEWSDSDYHPRTANIRTSRKFAREARDGQRVAIQYVDDLGLNPVIPSEHGECLDDSWISKLLGLQF
jgi:hypothetical protein